MRINPLSPLVFHRRNWNRSLIIVLTTVVATFGVIVVATVSDSTMTTYVIRQRYLQSVILVSPVGEETNLSDATVSLLRRSPFVKAVLRQITLKIEGTMIAGNTFFDCLFVSDQDALALLELYGLKMKEGRLPRRNTAEIAMSEELANNRGLRLGDKFSQNLIVDSDKEKTFTLVGILEGSTPLALGSYDLAERTLVPTGLKEGMLLILTDPARSDVVRQLLDQSLPTDKAAITSYQDVVQQVTDGTTLMQWVLDIIVALVAIVTASAAGLISVIHFNQRLTEFGILAALGYEKIRLVTRIINEIVGLVGVSWLLGAFASGLALYLFSSLVLGPQGLTIDLVDRLAFLYSAVAPIAMVLLSTLPVVLNLLQLDPVGIIERRI